MFQRITDEYITERIEAYNVAISALEMHESASDCNHALAYKLRRALADKLDREIQRWLEKVNAKRIATKP